MSKDIRRHPRVPFPGLIRLSWSDRLGTLRYARGRCLDLSASGMRVELPESIPIRHYVTVKAEDAAIAVNASVRHCARAGGKYIVGLEFSTPLKPNDPALPPQMRKALLRDALAGT